MEGVLDGRAVERRMIPQTLHDMGHFCGNHHGISEELTGISEGSMTSEIMGKKGMKERDLMGFMAKKMVTNGESMTIMNEYLMGCLSGCLMGYLLGYPLVIEPL